MCSRYMILYKNYEDACYQSYHSRWLVLALCKYVVYRCRYESVDLQYRGK